MKTLKFTVLLAFLYVFSHTTQAGTVFVDQNLAANCSGASYNVASRNCSGSAGSAYTSIQSAINSVSVGDVIYMRGGTYANISILVPQSKNGSSWGDGDFTTLMSYPGEWAVIDATGLSPTKSETIDAVIYGYSGFGTGEPANYTEYWKFSNFEIMGGGAGVHMKMRHVKWYYMYIHDNGRSGVSNLQSGILTVNPQYVEIKYSYFKDNINASAPNLNMAHVMFDSDYRDNNDNGGKGESWIPNASTHHNEVAYNYFELTGGNVGAQHIAIRQKNQQRFGYNDRDPSAIMVSKDYGDNIHHNIVAGSSECIGMGQDFLQVHNNICDNGINIGRFGDTPTTYHAVIYNNTVVNPATASFMTNSGLTTSGNTAMLNFYDNLPQQTVHPHINFYNNISEGNKNSYQDMPFLLHWDMPENTTNPRQDNADLVLENNLIHNNANEFDLIIGHNYDEGFSSCEIQNKSITEFNACSATWRSVGSVSNYKNNTGGLYLGSSGANKFITNHAFALGGGKTICDGGRSGPHPYLPGVALPGYVGATNPNDFAWVAGVLFDATSTNWLMGQVVDNPGWIEKTENQSGVCKAPPKPPTPA